MVSAALVVLLAVVGAGAVYAWRITQDEYYVGVANGKVVVYRGVNQAVAGMKPGSHVSLVVIRKGKRMTVPVTGAARGGRGRPHRPVPA